MIREEQEMLLSEFNRNPPAEKLSIQRFEATSGFILPEDYVRFLQYANGGEGFIGNSYVILWRVEELVQMNEAYQVPEYAPGLFLFGSDGGGEAFAFDTRFAERQIVCIPFVGLELELARPIAPNFEEFLEELLRS